MLIAQEEAKNCKLEQEARTAEESRAASLAQINQTIAELQGTLADLVKANDDLTEKMRLELGDEYEEEKKAEAKANLRELEEKCSKVMESLVESRRTIDSHKLKLQELEAVRRNMLDRQYQVLWSTGFELKFWI